VAGDVAYLRRRAGGVRTHHLHVVLAAHWDRDDRRRFRDILRARPDRAAACAALERDPAARRGPDRTAPTDAETGFVACVLRARTDPRPGRPGAARPGARRWWLGACSVPLEEESHVHAIAE